MESAKDGQVEPAQPRQPLRDVLNQTHSGIPVPARCKIPVPQKHVSRKKNSMESAKDGQVEPAQPRQPLRDVLNQTHSGIPVPARCKIPVPQKHVSRKKNSMESAKDGQVEPAQPRQPLRDVLDQTHSGIPVPARCKIPVPQKHVSRKKNSMESAKDGQVEPAQPRQPLRDVLNQTHSGIPVPARCKIPVPQKHVSRKKNSMESAKDGQVEPAQPRQPLRDVLDQTHSGIPVPARCKIPVPQKHVSRIPGLKHSSHRPSGLPRKSFCPKPQTSQKKDEKTSTKLRDSLVPKSVADNAISEVLEHSAKEKTEKDLKVSECGLKEKELQNSEPDVAESSGEDRIEGSSETGKSSVDHDCEKNVTTNELPPALHDGGESKNIETAEREDTTEHQSFGERKQDVGEALESGRNNECASPHFEKSKKEEKSVLPICQKKDDKAVPLSTLHKDKKTVHFYEATKKEINPLPHEDEKLYEHNGGDIVRPHCDSCMSCDCVSHLKESGQILVDSEHCHTLKDDVKVTKRILLLMERLNASTSEELFEATTQVGGLAAELKRVEQENAQLTSEVAALHIALSDKEAEKEALTQAERESAALALEDLEDRLQKETKQLVMTDYKKKKSEELAEKEKGSQVSQKSMQEAIEAEEKNKATLKKAVAEQKAMLKKLKISYKALKQQAEEKLRHASEELEKSQKTSVCDTARLQAQLKKEELQTEGLEKSMQQKNKATLKKAVAEQKAMLKKLKISYKALKQQAEEKLRHASEELEKSQKTSVCDTARLQAQLKKKELETEGLEKSMQQKIEENQELTKICEELISKMGM